MSAGPERLEQRAAEGAPAVRAGGLREGLLRLTGVLVLCYVAYAGLMYFGQDRMLFPRRFAGRPADRPPREEIEALWITAAGGERVEAWFLPGAGRSAAASGPAVIFFHGNAELLHRNVGFVQPYLDMGYSVLLPEYRGYGRSQGVPSEAAVVADGLMFYDWLALRPEVDHEQIVLHGRSLGGAVAAQVAARRDCRALIIEASVASVADFSHRYLLPERLCRNPFRTIDVLRALDRPVLLLHATGDRVIPIEHARRNLAAARRARLVEFEGDHDRLTRDWERYWAEIRALLREAGLPAAER